MAKRLSLVPSTWLQRLKEQRQSNNSSDNINSEELTKKFENIIEMMPKQSRSRAKILAHYIKDRVKLVNSSDLIVYEDETVGSPIYDLIRWVVTPRRFNTTKPFDADKFLLYLKTLNVPNSVYATDLTTQAESQKARSHSTTTTKWLKR